MYIEKRRGGKSVKYYLVYSYREKDKVKKVRRYLGLNIPEKELEKAKQRAEQSIRKEIEELSTEIFNFSLTKKQIEKLNKYDEKIRIHHFDYKDWHRFTTDFVYNTNAIEGSTVQLEEIDKILHKPKPENSEEIETRGVAKAVEFIKKTRQDLSLPLIKKLHKLCFEGSKHFAGRFRKVEVIVRNSRGEIMHAGIPAAQLHNSLKDMMDWYKI